VNPGDLIPIFGMITGILTVGAMSWAVVAIARGPLGQALSRRIGGAHHDGDLAQEVMALREQVEEMQHQLIDAQERLDFTERLLTRGDRADFGGEA
jgi:hypothetical protein